MTRHHHPARRPASRNDEFGQFLARFFDLNQDPSSVATSQWTPRVDIAEQEDQFLIQADIPGVDPKDIEIHMDKGILTIKGERTHENREEGRGLVRTERFSGSFHRRFSLPDSADAEGIKASGRNGVLEIAIPKKPETKPRRIEVQ